MEACVVDIFQSGDGSREKIRQREIAEWKQNYYLNKFTQDQHSSAQRNSPLKREQFTRPKRRNSQRVGNTRDDVILDMKDGLKKQIIEKEVEIHQIQKDFDDRVEALTVNMTMLRAQLPSNKYRMTKKFHVLPGYKIENQFQYPDMLSLTELSFEQLQPIRLGLNQFSALAQFGEIDEMKVGLEYERKNNRVECEIN